MPKVIFEVSAPDFITAGVVEEMLKAEKIPFTFRLSHTNGTVRVPGKTNTGIKRTRIDINTVNYVREFIDYNPLASDRRVANKFKISPATVGRIRHGKHALQRKKKRGA